ncbi:MAG TPA: monovalent cation/H+ antiporter complex subunit F [Microbacteriaceae bacterium]|nr:monovalent cation/H+ antiporter complex subunit F [Microbacteriaceae bacterium]
MQTDIIFIGAGVLFALAAIFALVHIMLGPTLLDRMVASDMLVTTLMLAVGAEMVYHRHTNTIVLMVALAATSFLATVMVARHVRKRDSVSLITSEVTKDV